MRKLFAYLFLVLLVTLSLTSAMAESDVPYAILCPSEAESRIAAGRDFYVIATVPEDATSATVRLLDAQGTAVRVLTGTNEPVFCTDFEGLNAFNADQAEAFMPDIVWNPDDPDSLYDGSIKCYLRKGRLYAVVAGGYYLMNGREIVDADGKPYAKLSEGAYVIEVEAGGETITAPLTMGPTEAKVMARFSPSGHLASVKKTATEGELRTYTDPLPGYWSPSAIVPDQESNPYFAELKERWQLADAMEYYNGEVHFYIYNLSASCATIAVELAALQLDGSMDTRLVCYYYDIGEPLLGYPEIGSDVYLMGTLVPFAKESRLAYPRAEVTATAEENACVVYTGEPRPIDTIVADGVTVPVGQTLTLFGVVRPIQNAPEDLVRLTESAWEIQNRIAQIEYTFRCEEQTWTERHDVGLNRTLAEGWVSYSLYEFAHGFTFAPELAGKTVTASTQGYDAHGAPVDGTAQTLSIAVSPAP